MVERIILILIGFVLGIEYLNCFQTIKRNIDAKKTYRIDRFNKSYSQMHGSGKSILPYLERSGIKTIVAYGAGYNYGILMSEMEHSSICVVLADRRSDYQRGIIAPEEIGSTSADMIVITSSYYFEAMFHKLKRMGENRPILSLQELVYNAAMESE